MSDGLKQRPGYSFLATWLFCTIALLLVAIPFNKPVGASEAAAYRLDSLDKIRVKVFEWRPTTDEVFEWKAMNETYTVGPTGNVSIPLLGDVTARGLTLADFSAAIGSAMRQRMRIAVVPNIAVEVFEYRPFYVTGDVQKPGEYAYRPGLTVLQSVAIAGGLGRRDEDARRIGRELINTEGDMELYFAERHSLIARRARLEAEIGGLDKIHYPVSLNPLNAGMRSIMKRETELFVIEKRSFQERVQTLARRRSHLQKEIETVQAQIQNHEQQKKLALSMLENLSALMERRLTVQPRHMEAQRNVYQLEAVGLQLASDLRVIYDNIAKVEAEEEELRNRRSATAIQELRATDLRITQLTRRIETSQRLYLDTARVSQQARYGDKEDEISYTYTVSRLGAVVREELDVQEASEILPGDTLKVQIKRKRSEENTMLPGVTMMSSVATQSEDHK